MDSAGRRKKKGVEGVGGNKGENTREKYSFNVLPHSYKHAYFSCQVLTAINALQRIQIVGK